MKHARLFGIIKTVNLPNICFMADKQTVAGVQGGGDPPPAPPLPLRECMIKSTQQHRWLMLAPPATHTQTKICTYTKIRTPVITAQFHYSYPVFF